jgi:probable F420-dependent oxidoreductase
MRFGISIPQTVGDGAFDPGAFRDYLTRAEQLGFESAWTLEQIIGSVPQLEPLAALTYAAACTERIRLGCAVLVTPLHNPVHLAKRLSTLDQLSRGRLDIGVGTGGPHRMFAAFEVDPDTYVARFTEGLRLMKALWTQPRVTVAGRFWQLDGAAMEPKPYQKPYPPIWFGAGAPASLRRAARLGDGYLGAGSATTEQFAGYVRLIRAALAELGRDPDTFPIAKRVYVAVDDDPARARQRMSDALDRYYGYSGRAGLVSVAVTGPPDECVAGLREVVAAGAGTILLNPLFDDAAQLERLAAEVIPRIYSG